MSPTTAPITAPAGTASAQPAPGSKAYTLAHYSAMAQQATQAHPTTTPAQP